MFKKLKFASIFIPLLLSVGVRAASYSGFEKDITSDLIPETVFIYGYFNANDAPFKMEEAFISQLKPIERNYIKMHVDNEKGVFYIENMKIGLYKFEGVGGIGKAMMHQLMEQNPFYRDRFIWRVRDEDRVHKIRKTGFYFLGSFGVRVVNKGGLFSKPNYLTYKSSIPSEIQVLEMILENVMGTKWEDHIMGRIHKLKNKGRIPT